MKKTCVILALNLKQKTMKTTQEVHVNYGKLLENQLLKWQGGSQHIRGIAEYISNSDDSYRRLNKFYDQEIIIEIYSRLGRKIDKLVIQDFAEGMSYDDLENKFFQYFDSFSGREQGIDVSGQFGTGGKAYAIMNFKECYIISCKDHLESKAWFKWDSENKVIIKGYEYTNKKVPYRENGTTIELNKCIKNHIELTDFVIRLNSLTRIRHVIKSQNIRVKLHQKTNKVQELLLRYDRPSGELEIWKFDLPDNLKNPGKKENILTIRYFEKPLNENAFIEISDGISSIADMDISKIDGRPFSKYLNGEMIVRKLKNSTAVKESRKGLEELDDLTIEIQNFLKRSVEQVINIIQDKQRKKEKERIIQTSNEKIVELNKFLNKYESEFSFVPRILKNGNNTFYKHKNEMAMPIKKETVHGIEVVKEHKVEVKDTKNNPEPEHTEPPKFNSDKNGGEVKLNNIEGKPKTGLMVLISDNNVVPEPERPVFSENDEPVIDSDLQSKGIIWINANNPLIVKYREKKENEKLFKETVANYVLLIVAQYKTSKSLEVLPEEEKDDPIVIFKKNYFDLQKLLREDKEVNYFELE